jgi:hypothetical protein
LNESAQHQQQRRRRSDRLTIGQKADADRARGHQKNGGCQRGLAAAQVSEAADDDAADGPDDETDAECGECSEQGRCLVRPGKEFTADGARSVRVNREVVPFEHIADRGGGNRLRPFKIHCGGLTY